MMTPAFVPISNEPRDYAWGVPGGISRALGRPATERVEAELWLGAHPLSPSRAEGWGDLAAWERATGRNLPYLLKVLAASQPLSLQAHPTPAAAAEGFAREEALGISRDAGDRNYKDPFAKPELIVAVEDGFEALCGFRDVAESRDEIEALAAASADPGPLRDWAAVLERSGLRAALEWALSAPDSRLVAGLADAAATNPGRFELVMRLATQYPDDPGVAVAMLLNHTTLAAGECLWLPAGNIHAYLRGIGVELMGPSDNVLRGGLTAKHVDVPELLRVLDVTTGPASRLVPKQVSPNVAVYSPAGTPTGADVPFALQLVTGDATVQTGGPAIALALDGEFALERTTHRHRLERGDAVLVAEGGDLSVSGAGRLYLATT